VPGIHSKALKEPALIAAEGAKENPPQADKKRGRQQKWLCFVK